MIKEGFRDKFYFYEGLETIEELEESLALLNLPKSKCYFIKFQNQYYAVFYDTYTREVIVGKEKMFYSKNGRLEEVVVGEVSIPFTINSRDNKRITDTLAQELNIIDPNLEVFYYPNIKSKEIKIAPNDLKLSKYVVILALSFASKFYDIKTSWSMDPYFKLTPELVSFLKKTKGVHAIDPFSQVVKFNDGSIGKYGITFYMNSSFQSCSTFALLSKNYYANEGRSWISILKYQELYPNDFIMYEKPDFRTEKDTCKWCSKKITNEKFPYCSNLCKQNYLKATVVAKGAILPYKILCRDKFICQLCEKDLAMINEHGVKIPIARKADKPDKDGKFRSIAEVHHIVAVEDGGEFFQENLITACEDCHKEEHKKRGV